MSEWEPVGLPFEGVDGWLRWALLIGFVVVVIVFCWTLTLAVLAERWSHATARRDRRIAHDGSPAGGSEADFCWIFLVPALDEELTIADSIARLRLVDATRRLIVVIDDGSTDDTPAILDELAGEDLVVVRRELPDAQRGKSAALDDAWRRLPALLAERGMPRDRVITCVVDADGRLAPNAPERIALRMLDTSVGGVQVLVRIYNRRGLLTWMQDLEFRIMGLLFQGGRSRLGCAGMGGNGQFNRLVALDTIADSDGPWRDVLTEDQDLGLRLLGQGWTLVHDNGTSVDQQGPNRLGVLYRQRTRWAQGNLQAMRLLPTIMRTRSLGVAARIEQVAALLMPLWQIVVGFAFALAAWQILFHDARFFGDAEVTTIVFYILLSFSGVVVGCTMQGWRTGGIIGLLVGVIVTPLYALYSWLLWPVLIRALLRQTVRRRGWAKTEREQVDPEDRVPTARRRGGRAR
jgi:cellulose synthase/poly-beta-1,6-N-acetylglucosamine synthase-like glycosyltransferase